MLNYDTNATGEPASWEALGDALRKPSILIVHSFPTNIGGSDNLQLRIRGLLSRYRYDIGRTIVPTPALIKPMVLQVDEAMGYNSSLTSL